MPVSRSWTGEDDILFFLAVLFAMNYWHCKIADVTCDDFSGETPPPSPNLNPLPQILQKGGGLKFFP